MKDKSFEWSFVILPLSIHGLFLSKEVSIRYEINEKAIKLLSVFLFIISLIFLIRVIIYNIKDILEVISNNKKKVIIMTLTSSFIYYFGAMIFYIWKVINIKAPLILVTILVSLVFSGSFAKYKDAFRKIINNDDNNLGIKK